MDFDITTVRKLTALRNKPGLPFHLKDRLSSILKTAENINAAEPGPYRDELIASFKRQWSEYTMRDATEIGDSDGTQKAS